MPIRAGDGCLTLFGGSELIVQRLGRESQPGGLDYVAHPDPVDLPVAAPTAGVTRLVADDSMVPADAELVAVWVVATAPADRPGSVSHADCASGASAMPPQAVTAPPGHTHGNLMLLPTRRQRSASASTT